MAGLKVYTLEEVKEEYIDNKELYEFKLWISVELGNILYSSEESNTYYRKQLRNLLNKINNG